MSARTVTTVGYGLRADLEVLRNHRIEFGYEGDIYEDHILESERYPRLEVEPSGHALSEEYWVFIRSTMTQLRSGGSGLGAMGLPLPAQNKPSAEELQQLTDWQNEIGLNGDGGWVVIQYVY